MKKYFLICLFVLGFLQVFSQNIHPEYTKIILTRHLERDVNDPTDPDLTPQGKNRAEFLKKMFENVSIDYFYSTFYKRVQQTLLPLAELKGKEIKVYSGRDYDFIKNTAYNHPGKTLMISGHSNTIPFLVNAFLGEEMYEELDEKDYSKIWILILKGEKVIDCQLLQY